MAKKKPDDKATTPARYPTFQLRLHPSMRGQLDALAARNTTDVSEEIRTAIRKHLEANGMWPPPPEKTAE